ncbi:MAG: SGNH/GDSL hydrolase family protein [Christensenella sp.]
MKTIVCYGDSNTWGCSPINCERIARNLRWTGALQSLLGDDYLIYEEGMNARTTMFDDPIEPYRSGVAYIEPCMYTDSPVDLLVIMLGTNDVKTHLGQTAFSISKGIERLIIAAQNPVFGRDNKPCEILIVSPVEIFKGVAHTWLGDYFNENSVETARELAPRYKAMAELYGCHFMDAAAVAEPSPVDCVHMDEKNHAKLARAIYSCVKEILG